jgi:hypothetical protein
MGHTPYSWIFSGTRQWRSTKWKHKTNNHNLDSIGCEQVQTIKMKNHRIIGNLLLLLGSVSANQQWIAGYDPLTFVNDHAVIDLDQREIEKWLDVDIFQQAEKVYGEGGHSQSLAQLRLFNPEPPTEPFPAGTIVYGTGVGGSGVQGRLVKETTWTKTKTIFEVVLLVEYDREKSVNLASHCQVGALSTTDSSITNGCKSLEKVSSCVILLFPSL